jgi:hypothetical protein
VDTKKGGEDEKEKIGVEIETGVGKGEGLHLIVADDEKEASKLSC